MNVLDIRECTPADEPQADEVDRLATADLRTVYRPTVAAEQRRSAILPQLRRLVAVLDGRVVGVVRYRVDDGRLGFLSLGVHPEFRRRGIASALVERLERIARDDGCRCVTLYTVRETGNVDVFQRMGFAVEAEEPSDLFESSRFPTLTEVAMRKQIAARAE